MAAACTASVTPPMSRPTQTACCQSPRAEDRRVRPPRRPAHGVAVGRLDAEREGRRAVRDEVDPEDLDGQQRQGQAQEGSQHHDPDLGRVRRQHVAHEAADVVVDAPALLDRCHDGREVVVGQDHVGGFLADVRAGDAHGHADVGSAQGRGIVHAVAGHGDDGAPRPPGIDDAQLLLGVGAGVDADVDRPVPRRRRRRGPRARLR